MNGTPPEQERPLRRRKSMEPHYGTNCYVIKTYNNNQSISRALIRGFDSRSSRVARRPISRFSHQVQSQSCRNIERQNNLCHLSVAFASENVILARSSQVWFTIRKPLAPRSSP